MTQLENVAAQQIEFVELIGFVGPKVFYALICGGLVGLERELKSKAAGIKTNMLICVGATIYTCISILISTLFSENTGFFGDPARIAAQIVSGIGFLGGGAIIQARGSVVGLTTAATIWLVAALGIFIGMGYHFAAIVIAIVIVLTLTFTSFIENRFMVHMNAYLCIIKMDDSDEVRRSIIRSLEKNDLTVTGFDMGEAAPDQLTLRYRGMETDHIQFLLGLWSIPGVKRVKEK